MKKIKRLGMCLMIACMMSSNIVQPVLADESMIIESAYEVEQNEQTENEIPPSMEIITNADIPEINVEEVENTNITRGSPNGLRSASLYSADNILTTGRILDYGTGVYMVDFGVNAINYYDVWEDRIRNNVIEELFINGELVYCIEPEVLTADGEGYDIGAIDEEVSYLEQFKLGLISYFGYGYNSDASDLMQAATRAAVWNARGRTVSAIVPELQAKIDEIEHRVATVSIRPSFEKQTITFTGYGKEHAVTLTDTNGVFHDYVIGSTGGYSVEKNGDTLKVWVERGAVITGNVEYDRIDRTTMGQSIVYVSPNNKQTVMKINATDPHTTEVKPGIAPGSLQYTKRDADGANRSGTTVSVYYDDNRGNPIGNFTTGAGGVFNVPNLDPTKVCFKETGTTADLILDTTEHCVNVSGNAVSYYTQTNQFVEGKLKFVKKDADTGRTVALAGTKINVYKSNNVFVGTYTTGSDGSLVSPNLRYGDYYFVEDTAPSGFVINSQKVYFSITSNGQVIEKTLSNIEVKGNIHVTKADSITGMTPQGNATFEGAVYGLYARENILSPDDKHVIYRKGTLVDKQAIKNGALDFKNHYLGNYYVQEITPSEGYLLDPTKYLVDIVYQNQNTAVVNINLGVKEIVKSQAFKFIKVSSDGSSTEIPTVQGAEFTAKLESDVQALGWDLAPVAKNYLGVTGKIIVTDKYGQALSDRYPYGKYRVRETKVPENMQPVKDFIVDITEDSNEPQQWRVFNDAPDIKAYIKLAKRDLETNNIIPIPGIEFRLKNTDTGEYVKQWLMYPIPVEVDIYKTASDGTLTTPQKLLPGHYQWEEVKAPGGYVLNLDPIPFVIDKNSAYQVAPDGESILITVDVFNEQTKGKIVVQKQGEIFKGFDFRQTEYGLLNEPIFQKGNLDEVTYTLTAREDIMTPDLTLWYSAGDVVSELTTNDGKVLSFDDLRLGAYLLTETTTHDGYVLDTKSYPIDLLYEGQEIKIVDEFEYKWNEKQRAYIEFEKMFDESLFLSNEDMRNEVRYGLFTATPLVVDGVEQLEEDSLLSVIGLSDLNKGSFLIDFEGDYYVQELATHDNLILDDTKHYFSYHYSDENSSMTELKFDDEVSRFENHLKRGSAEIVKTDNEDGHFMKNVPFVLSTTNDFKEILQEQLTNDSGSLLFENLEYGTYYAKEKERQYGYTTNDTLYKIVISEDTPTVKIEVENTRIRGMFEFIKTDEFNKYLEGVEIEFSQNEDLSESTILTTDKFGTIMVDDLAEGTYYYRESKTLPGLVLDTTIYKVEITKHKQRVIKTLVNNHRKSSITIHKMDEDTKESLTGFTFVVFDKNKKVIKYGTTDLLGLLTFDDLLNGAYDVYEVSGLDNYELLKEPIKVVIEGNDSGQEIKLDITNKFIPVIEEPEPEIPVIEIPQTSDSNSMNFLLFGVFMSCCVIVGISVYSREKNKKGKK